MEKSNRLFFIILIILAVSFIFAPDMLAHELLIDEVGKDYGIAKFDAGAKAMEVDVNLYNENEEVILTTKTDLEGLFEFDEDMNPAKIVVIDEYGHRAVWDKKDQTDKHESSRWLRALLGLSLLLIIGLGSKFKRRFNLFIEIIH